jgi:hypothetical protein
LDLIEHVVDKSKSFSDAFLFFKFTKFSNEKNFKEVLKKNFESLTVVEQLDLRVREFSTDYIGRIFIKFLSQIEVKTRKYKLKSYPNCNGVIFLNVGWVSKDALEWGLLNTTFTIDELILLFEFYRKTGLIEHVVDKTKCFSYDFLFFRFSESKKNVKLKIDIQSQLMNEMLKSLFPQENGIILGISNSGKTTLFKLLKYHYLKESFSENEYSQIYLSILMDVKKLIEYGKLTHLKSKYDVILSENHMKEFLDYETSVVSCFKVLKLLCDEKEVKDVWCRRVELEIPLNDHLP